MDIYEFLTLHEILYRRYDHEPVFTCEQADRLDIRDGSAKTKNLFLRDRKGTRHILVTVAAGKEVSLKALGSLLEAKSLSFASAERLDRYLRLSPGSVTLLGLVNDREGKVEMILDQDLLGFESMQCHPLVNTSTLVITMDEVMRFLDLTGHRPRVLRVPEQDWAGL